MKIDPLSFSLSFPVSRSVAVVIAFIAFAIAAPLQASVIFQADFNGTGGGTGGASDLVTTGGTGTLNDAGGGTATVQTSPTLGQGAFFNSAQNVTPTGSGHGARAIFTPSSAANNFSAMQTLGTNVALHGGGDFFLRSNDPGDGGYVNSWTRPFDYSSNSSTTGLRFIMNGQGTTKMRLQITGPTNSILTGAGYTTTGNSVLFDATAPGGSWIDGQTYHFGFTFETDVNDVVTAKLFAATGTGAIDTTSSTNLIGSTTFKIDGAIVTTGFDNHDIVFNPGGTITNGNAGDLNRSVDADVLRLYDSAPATFQAIPEPSTIGLLTLSLSLVGFLAMGRRAGRQV